MKWGRAKTKHSLLRLRQALHSYILGCNLRPVLRPVLETELAVAPFREVIQEYVEQIQSLHVRVQLPLGQVLNESLLVLLVMSNLRHSLPGLELKDGRVSEAVSYTHLTLPTT